MCQRSLEGLASSRRDLHVQFLSVVRYVLTYSGGVASAMHLHRVAVESGKAAQLCVFEVTSTTFSSRALQGSVRLCEAPKD